MSYSARNITEIKAAITDNIKANPDLYDELDDTKLNNKSAFAIWSGLVYVVAVAIHIFESLMQNAFDDLEVRKSQIHPNTTRYMAYESLFFQYGDDLELNQDDTVYLIPTEGGEEIRVSPLNVDYAVYDETKRIVTAASVSSESGIVLIKAAKSDIDGNPIPLEALEYSGFESYWNNKASAGQSFQIVSQEGDEIYYSANIEIDGQKISSTGESQTETGVFPVVDAIKQYYKDLDFAGELTLLKLEDAIQGVDGVNNIKSTMFSAKPFGSIDYIDIFETTTNKYSSIAGYCIEDTANLLENNLNYIIS